MQDLEFYLTCFDHLVISPLIDTCGWGHNGWREPIDGRVAWHSGVGCCLKSSHCWDVGSTGRSGQLQSSLLANQASVKRCVRLTWKKWINMIVRISYLGKFCLIVQLFLTEFVYFARCTWHSSVNCFIELQGTLGAKLNAILFSS